jgi:hypothetical protein
LILNFGYFVACIRARITVEILGLEDDVYRSVFEFYTLFRVYCDILY